MGNTSTTSQILSIGDSNISIVYGYIRQNDNIIPECIIVICLKYYAQLYQVIPFDAKYRSKNNENSIVELQDNDTTAIMKICLESSPTQWLLLEFNPMINDIHCFRFHVKKPTKHCWIVVGISKRKMYWNNRTWLSKTGIKFI